MTDKDSMIGRPVAVPKNEALPEKVTLHEGESMILHKEQNRLIHRCCNCGMVHSIEFRSRKPQLEIAFVELDELPPLDGCYTEIKTSDGKTIIWDNR